MTRQARKNTNLVENLKEINWWFDTYIVGPGSCPYFMYLTLVRILCTGHLTLVRILCTGQDPYFMYLVHGTDFINTHKIIWYLLVLAFLNIILIFLFLPSLKQIPLRLEQLQTLYFIYRKSFIENCTLMKCEKEMPRI